jgi:hypothetical protein
MLAVEVFNPILPVLFPYACMRPRHFWVRRQVDIDWRKRTTNNYLGNGTPNYDLLCSSVKDPSFSQIRRDDSHNPEDEDPSTRPIAWRRRRNRCDQSFDTATRGRRVRRRRAPSRKPAAHSKHAGPPSHFDDDAVLPRKTTRVTDFRHIGARADTPTFVVGTRLTLVSF